MNKMEKKEIITFSAISIILSSLICLISYLSGKLSLSMLSVFIPSILAFVITGINHGKQGIYDLFVKQTIKKIRFKWLLISLIGIPVVGCLAVLTSLNFDISRFGLRTTQLIPQIIIILLIALGEEYGWRGFLLPRLMNRFNLFHSSILLGLIWGFWHFPGYLIGAGVPLQMNFIVFLLWVILGSLFIGWIYYYTKSVLTSILAHISANAAFNYLLILPEFTADMHTFWIFICYMAILMMMVLIVRRKDLI